MDPGLNGRAARDDELARLITTHCTSAIRALELGQRAVAIAHLHYAALLAGGLQPDDILGLQSVLRWYERSH